MSNQRRHVRLGDGDELFARDLASGETDVDEDLPATCARERRRILLSHLVMVYRRLLHDTHDRVGMQMQEERTRNTDRRTSVRHCPGHGVRRSLRARDFVVPRKKVPTGHVLELLSDLHQEAPRRDRDLELGAVPEPNHEPRERRAVVRRQKPEVVVAGVDDVAHLQRAQINGVERQDRRAVDEAIREATFPQAQTELHERRARDGGVDEHLSLPVHERRPQVAERGRHHLLLTLVQLGEPRFGRLRARPPHEPHLRVSESGRTVCRVVLGLERLDELRALHRLLDPGGREPNLVPELHSDIMVEQLPRLSEVLLTHGPDLQVLARRENVRIPHDDRTEPVQGIDERARCVQVILTRQRAGEVDDRQIHG